MCKLHLAGETGGARDIRSWWQYNFFIYIYNYPICSTCSGCTHLYAFRTGHCKSSICAFAAASTVRTRPNSRCHLRPSLASSPSSAMMPRPRRPQLSRCPCCLAVGCRDMSRQFLAWFLNCPQTKQIPKFVAFVFLIGLPTVVWKGLVWKFRLGL